MRAVIACRPVARPARAPLRVWALAGAACFSACFSAAIAPGAASADTETLEPAPRTDGAATWRKSVLKTKCSEMRSTRPWRRRSRRW